MKKKTINSMQAHLVSSVLLARLMDVPMSVREKAASGIGGGGAVYLPGPSRAPVFKRLVCV